ncbi:putative reverse transcriptase domain-containing protein [Tanacetum coccineum]
MRQNTTMVMSANDYRFRYTLSPRILNAQTEARKPENIKSEDVGGMLVENAKFPKAIREQKCNHDDENPVPQLHKQDTYVMAIWRTVIHSRIPEWKWDNITMDFVTKLPKTSQGYDTIWVIIDRLTKSAIFTPMRETDLLDKLARLYLKEIKQRMQAARDRQKSYADLKRKPMEFQVGDKVMLKVSPWKGVVRFGKRGKLNPRYVGPFKVIERVGEVAYKLELPNN